MSEEIATAAADLATVEALRARVLEWEDAYDRLAGAFDLHLAIGECNAAAADYVSGYYDLVLGVLAEQADYWRVQAQDVLTDLHTAEAKIEAGERARDALTDLEEARRQLDELRDTLERQTRELTLLRELRDDVQRWRESGGDARELRYVLETLEKASGE